MDKKKRPPLNLANLNEILFAEDLAYIFNITAKQAGQNLASGLYGPRILIGKQYAILREKLLEHLAAGSELPEAARAVPSNGTSTADRLIAHHQRNRRMRGGSY